MPVVSKTAPQRMWPLAVTQSTGTLSVSRLRSEGLGIRAYPGGIANEGR
jgi:hypothetical protein